MPQLRLHLLPLEHLVRSRVTALLLRVAVPRTRTAVYKLVARL